MKLIELKITVPLSKPRDPNNKILQNKVNASGAHRDKKAELKKGKLKHKGQMHEAAEPELTKEAP